MPGQFCRRIRNFFGEHSFMSLVVDALKKLKHENKQAADIQAPPSMKTEHIDNDGKKNGKGEVSKGFVATAVVLCVIIAAAAIIGVARRTKDTVSMTGKATIVTQKEAKPQSGTLKLNQTPAVKKTEPAAPAAGEQTSAEKQAVKTGAISRTDSEWLFPMNAEKTAVPVKNTKTGGGKGEYIDPLNALSGGKAPVKKETAQKTQKKPVNAPEPEKMPKTSAPAPSKSPATAAVPLQANQSPIDMGTNSDYLSLLSQGKSAWDKKDYKSALDYYTKAYEMRGEQPVAGNIATLYFAAGEPGKAVKTVKETGLRNITTVSRLIIEMVNKNFIYEANELIKYSRVLNDNGELAYAEGYYHHSNRSYQKAIIAFNRARGLNPSEAVYSYSYARALDADGKYAEAVDAYKGTLALNPDKKTEEYSKARIESLKEYIK